MGTPKPINLLDPFVGSLNDTDLFPTRDPVNPPAQKATLLQLAQYITTKLTASDGLSKDLATDLIFQLGQTVGRAGDPAALTENREIPNPGDFVFYFGSNNGIAGVVAIDSENGISISNANGNWIEMFDGGTNYKFYSPTTGIFIFNLGTQNLTFDGSSLVLSWDQCFSALGYKGHIRQNIGVAETFQQTDETILIDTSLGDVTVSLDRASLSGFMGNVKKISADTNNVILLPTAGTIQELGAPVASISFNTEGQSKSIRCNGTNFFIV